MIILMACCGIVFVSTVLWAVIALLWARDHPGSRMDRFISA